MPRSALIIEDDADIAESVRYNLESAGFRTAVAATGESGLSLALDPEHPPAVIVLDLMLPGLSGIEICRRLRRENQTRRTPIIIMRSLPLMDRASPRTESTALAKRVEPT